MLGDDELGRQDSDRGDKEYMAREIACEKLSVAVPGPAMSRAGADV